MQVCQKPDLRTVAAAGEMIDALAKKKVATEVLINILSTVQQQHTGPADKKLKSAYFQLVQALRVRGQQELLQQVTTWHHHAAHASRQASDCTYITNVPGN